MISTPAFAQMDLSELLPSLRELEMVLGDAGGSHICPIPVSEPVQKEAPIAAGAKLKSLTPRETQVLRLIAEGNSTKEIAHLLGMSFKTAACHRYRVMDKLEIHDAVSLTRFAVRAGLVTL
jgi:DNA-binding NarL/FixJ family response regulator